MNFSLNAEIVGLASAVVAELLKLFPQISKTPIVMSLVAMLVVFVACLLTTGFTWQNFGTGLLYAFLNYQIVVQPAAKSLGSSTQA